MVVKEDTKGTYDRPPKNCPVGGTEALTARGEVGLEKSRPVRTDRRETNHHRGASRRQTEKQHRTDKRVFEIGGQKQRKEKIRRKKNCRIGSGKKIADGEGLTHYGRMFCVKRIVGLVWGWESRNSSAGC